MTVFEVAIAAAVLGILLFVLAGGARAVRRQAKRNLGITQMTALREALAAYEAATDAYPPAAPDGSAGPAIAALLAVPETAAKLEPLPASLELGQDPQAGGLDPWGRPLRYLAADATRERDRAEVAANGGRPLFESAGPDGDFGHTDPGDDDDNLRSSDLR
ncbi:MAG: hypothetical protein JXA69_01495 [Phycisphaerae bacterium]|nr:hypothetical protein [Phycisphaerae bacterium]